MNRPTDETAATAGSAQASATPKRQKADPISRALRVAYDDMLRENIPDDFMDLLGKLD